MKRKDLKPGVLVKNTVSKLTGVVRADPKNRNRLMRAHDDYVRVRMALPPWQKRKTRLTTWLLRHVEFA